MARSIPKSVRELAVRHKVALGRDAQGNYTIRDPKTRAVVEMTRTAKPTAEHAKAMIRRYLKNPARLKKTAKTAKRPRRAARKTRPDPAPRRGGVGFYQIFKCRGFDVRFLAMTTEGKLRWTVTRRDTVRWQRQAEAAKIARRLARRRDLAGYTLGVVDGDMSLTKLINRCADQRPKA